ncbi:hypothetical protein QNA08_07500 [Chelatococcus sp. SYSU_G07232]|uniref:Thymidylate kinase n=1 Tax=Chelatococcus albus TaxID=3047466 RepID=A0ABT7AFG9_9HYPH|nr:hypothetical protein [Chelatococcus sp. SYSU_G07232]MDJ1158078.1 hypothetical protein [Chelatococcus sp. SYSU_G07232]
MAIVNVPGIAIEGVDYIGKTTVAEAILRRLTVPPGAPTVVYRKCYMSAAPLVRFLDERARLSDDLETRDWYYTAALMIDLQTLAPVPGAIHLQERHWLTQLGRNAFFHGGKEIYPSERILAARTVFDLGVMLTSDLATKQERARGRLPGSPRDSLLASDPRLHQAYEDFVVGLVPRNEPWIVVDTTNRSPEAVASIILDAYATARSAA